MEQLERSGWVAVRCIFRTDVDGVQSYEERVTLWQSTSMDAAIELAEAEADEYAAALSGPPGNATEFVGLSQAYLLFDRPEHGAEMFSLIRQSDLDPDDYIDRFFETGGEYQRSVDPE